MGEEPDPENIPVEYDDLLLDVQVALDIYHKLKDEWDGMNGVYLGKSYAGISDILSILEVPTEDRKTVFNLIGMIDRHRSDALEEKRPKSPSK